MEETKETYTLNICSHYFEHHDERCLECPCAQEHIPENDCLIPKPCENSVIDCKCIPIKELSCIEDVDNEPVMEPATNIDWDKWDDYLLGNIKELPIKT